MGVGHADSLTELVCGSCPPVCYQRRPNRRCQSSHLPTGQHISPLSQTTHTHAQTPGTKARGGSVCKHCNTHSPSHQSITHTHTHTQTQRETHLPPLHNTQYLYFMFGSISFHCLLLSRLESSVVSTLSEAVGLMSRCLSNSD